MTDDDKETAWAPLQGHTVRREETLDELVIRWAWDDISDHTGTPMWIDFAVYSVVGTDTNGMRYFELPNFTSAPKDWTTDINEAAPTVSGFVKWDGCTQFGYPHGVHVDDMVDLQALHRAIEHARRVALVEIMLREER